MKKLLYFLLPIGMWIITYFVFSASVGRINAVADALSVWWLMTDIFCGIATFVLIRFALTKQDD